jgi:uncharacterized protein
MGGRALRVNVAPLRKRAGTRQQFVQQTHVGGLSTSGSQVPDGAEVTVEVALESLQGGAILVEGSVVAPWAGDCRRCVGPAVGQVDIRVRELFEPGSDHEETYPLEGDQIDLEPLVRDAVLLELPQAPVCADTCQGLCPTCGINRNEGTCDCEPEVRDPRWAALDQLKSQD